MKKNVKKTPKKESFGYACSDLFPLKYNSPVGNEISTFVKSIPNGEGSLYDAISFNRSLSKFNGNQISQISEFANQIKYYYKADEIHKVFNKKTLSRDFKRVLFHFILNEYYYTIAMEYFTIQNTIKQLLS